MERREELLKLFDGSDKATMLLLIDKMLFLEKQLEYLETLPFIKTHPEHPEMQKSTPAAKQYKELLQQYISIIRTISRNLDDDSNEEVSPLRKWTLSRMMEV